VETNLKEIVVTLRVCPECGYIDPPYWLHSKFSYHIDTISFENFHRVKPELAKELTKGGAITEDKYYYYRLAKTKNRVFRKAKIEWTESNPFGAEKYEKFNHGYPTLTKKRDRMLEVDVQLWKKAHPNQQKLLSKE
jgi:hypothetical protein